MRISSETEFRYDSEGVPEGKMQFWRDGELLMELDVEV
jgi:hypothetical protein